MVIISKLLPPQPHRGIFHRERLQQLLSSTLRTPLTLIHAGTGFGKTTTLLELSSLYTKVFWYQVTEPDRDPMLFLAHLVSAFLPASSSLLDRLENGGNSAAPAVMTALINQLTLDLEEDAVLVLDDYHLVSDVQDINHWFEQLVENRPPRLSVAIACRKIPDSPAFIRWRVKGSLLVIDQSDLSFTVEEIKNLFSNLYDFPVTSEQAETIFSYTDGWVIALQMIWQRLRSSRSRQLDRILAELPTALSDVFNFLAQEVLERQPEHVQKFLLSSAVLRQLDTDACNAILEIENGKEILHSLVEKGLFTFLVNDESYRYQRLFQDFLLDQGKNDLKNMEFLHLKAAKYYIGINDSEEAIYHLFSGGKKAEAAKWIENTGPHMLAIGRLRTISKWIDQLDDSLLYNHPLILLLKGDVQRLRSQFEDAISSYSRAEKTFIDRKDNPGRSLAIRSKAQVYLDTIRPLKASSLLEEAISLLEPQEHPAEVSALLDQLAENKLNLGKPDEARALHKEASMLRKESDPDDIYLEVRSLLRTGRLLAAVERFEPYQAELADTPTIQRPQRFHREMPLLLSLIHLMLGNIEKGERYAQQGIETGRQLDSPFVEAVGWMRLGHALQLYPQLPWRTRRLELAREYYQHSIELVRPFNVVRVQVEPLWGLCRFYGYQGSLTEARRIADQAVEIADSSGDYWFVGLIQATMGTSYALSGEFDLSEKWLSRSTQRFTDVGDIFGVAAARLASAFNHWRNGDRKISLGKLDDLIPDLIENDLGFLLTRPSHLGLQDVQELLPMLLAAYRSGIHSEWIASLSYGVELSKIDFHPGYGLAIRTLGRFDIWRGKNMTNPREWQREKARQLFQFFISQKGKWFTREQLADRLWPDLDPDAAAQNLKVALNALNRTLEPTRETGQLPFFITRRDTLYGVNPAAHISLDVDDFLQLSTSEKIEDLQDAVAVYQGDYLGENYAESWASALQQTLRDTYIQTSLRLARLLFESDRWDESMRVCHDMLSTDPCNESVFQLLMHSQAARGNRAAVQSIYQRCCAILREDLDVDPSPDTTALYKQLTK